MHGRVFLILDVSELAAMAGHYFLDHMTASNVLRATATPPVACFRLGLMAD